MSAHTRRPTLAGRRIAVLGGAGFAGHHVALGLAREGATVEVVDSLREGHLLDTLTATDDALNREYHLGDLAGRIEALRTHGVTLAGLDARDPAALTMRFERTKPEIVVHAVPADNEDAHSEFEHGLRSLDALLEASRAGESHVVLLSSDLVYGRVDEAAEETRESAPTCLAGARHATAEAWLGGVCRHQQRAFTVVRSGPLYGPRAAGRGKVASFVENALAGEPLRLTGEGRERRDYTHVDDFVAGLILLLRDPTAAIGVWNLSYGHDRTEREVAERVAEYFAGSVVEATLELEAAPRRIPLSIEKARQRLGFCPRRPLESGIPEVVRELLDAAGVQRAPRHRRRERRPWAGARPAVGPMLR